MRGQEISIGTVAVAGDAFQYPRGDLSPSQEPATYLLILDIEGINHGVHVRLADGGSTKCASAFPCRRPNVEIIKYTLSDQVGALTTLRGKLYDLEEATRLGFFHEVVDPDKLLATAIGYARCITPDCNTAYAMSKKALQDSVLRQIEKRTGRSERTFASRHERCR